MSALIIYSDENLVLLETEGKYHLHRELETWSYLVFYAFCDFWTTSERNIRTLKSPWIHSITNSKPKFAPLVCLLLLITGLSSPFIKKIQELSDKDGFGFHSSATNEVTETLLRIPTIIQSWLLGFLLSRLLIESILIFFETQFIQWCGLGLVLVAASWIQLATLTKRGGAEGANWPGRQA